MSTTSGPSKKIKRTIGRSDLADFPELGLEDVAIKIDTGAYTSSIHCHRIEVERDDEGRAQIAFALLDPSHEQYNEQVYRSRRFTQRDIKNSFGTSETRYVIETDIRLFGKTHPIELSLSERGEMKFPVLIGRRFLSRKYLVDPDRRNLSHKHKAKRSR